MIDVQRITEHDSLGAGKGETRRHVTMSRESCERLTAGKHTPERCEAAFKFFARPGGKGINPPTLRRDGDLALFPPSSSGRCHVTCHGFKTEKRYLAAPGPTSARSGG
jgi:hypothetical protein